MLRALFLAALAAVASSLTLYKFDAVNAFKAYSLDGTPGAFMFSPGSGANANDWIIYHQYGGWCYSIQDCYGRSLTKLGSSRYLPAHADSLGGLVSDNCTVTPLCNYNKVVLQYTDGNSFAGNLDAPVPYTTPNGTTVNIWFRGRAIIDATLDALQRNVMNSANLIVNARHIIATGCSAGGLATYLHADYYSDYFKGKITGTFLSMPISGYFLDAVSLTGVKQYGAQMAVIHALSNASTNAECEAAYAGAEAYKCNMAEYVYPFIRAPVFVLNSFADSWQSSCVMTAAPVFSPHSLANGNCSGLPNFWHSWYPCTSNPANCTPAQIAELYIPFGAEMVTSISATNAAKSGAAGSGGFLTSCHTHCEALNYFDTFTIGTPSMRDVAAAWITANQKSGGASKPQWLVDAPYAAVPPYVTNPSCGVN